MESITDIQKQKGKLVLDYLSNGLSENDSLILVEWTHLDFENYKKENSRFAELVERKKIEYKQKLMNPIVKAVEKGDSRIAQWLLERQFYNDFSTKKKPTEESTNPIAVIVNQIQMGTIGSTLTPATRAARKYLKPNEMTQIDVPKTSDTQHVIDMHESSNPEIEEEF